MDRDFLSKKDLQYPAELILIEWFFLEYSWAKWTGIWGCSQPGPKYFPKHLQTKLLLRLREQ